MISFLIHFTITTMKNLKILILLFLMIALQYTDAQETVRWKFTTGAAIHASAVIAGNSVFIGSADRNLYALDKTTGALQWKFETKGAVHSTPAVYAGKVYCSSTDGNIYSVDKETGKLAWVFATNGEQQYDGWDYYLSSPVVINGAVYTGSGDSCVYALDAETGRLIWKYKTNGMVHATPVIGNGLLYFGSFDGYFYALDATNGQLKWKFKTVGNAYFPLGEIQKAAAIDKNTVIFGSRDYNIYALNAATGTGIWNMKEPGSWIIATPLVHGRHIYFGTSDSHRFYCMDIETGTVKWILPLNMRVFGTACFATETIAFGCFNGKLFFVNPETGKIDSVFQTDESKQNYATVYDATDDFRKDFELYGEKADESEKKIMSLGSILSDPLVENDILYFGDANGIFYALSLK